MSRRYELKRRAENMDETRRRITEAAVELHRTIGPARTTISAVAARAGVERLTLYRHFPDEEALFQACTSHWLASNPPPDTAAWAAIADPAERLSHALGALYQYFGRTADMWTRAYRDAQLVPALQRPMSEWLNYLRQARDVLTTGWGVRGRHRRQLEIAIGHALSFTTWASLNEQGADRRRAIALMRDMVSASARRTKLASYGETSP